MRSAVAVKATASRVCVVATEVAVRAMQARSARAEEIIVGLRSRVEAALTERASGADGKPQGPAAVQLHACARGKRHMLPPIRVSTEHLIRCSKLSTPLHPAAFTATRPANVSTSYKAPWARSTPWTY